jgi:hypothetical protein
MRLIGRFVASLLLAGAVAGAALIPRFLAGPPPTRQVGLAPRVAVQPSVVHADAPVRRPPTSVEQPLPGVQRASEGQPSSTGLPLLGRRMTVPTPPPAQPAFASTQRQPPASSRLQPPRPQVVPSRPPLPAPAPVPAPSPVPGSEPPPTPGASPPASQPPTVLAIVTLPPPTTTGASDERHGKPSPHPAHPPHPPHPAHPAHPLHPVVPVAPVAQPARAPGSLSTPACSTPALTTTAPAVSQNPLEAADGRPSRGTRAQTPPTGQPAPTDGPAQPAQAPLAAPASPASPPQENRAQPRAATTTSDPAPPADHGHGRR